MSSFVRKGVKMSKTPLDEFWFPRKMNKSILFSITAFILACGPGDTLAIDAKFTDQEVYLIERAIQQWVSVTDSEYAAIFTFDGFDRGGFFFAENYDKSRGYSVIFKVNSNSPGYKKLEQKQGRSFIGLANSLNGNMVIVSDKTGEATFKFYSTVLHELGHFYGLDHLRPPAIMRPKFNNIKTQCITPADLAAFCDRNYCGSNAKSDCDNPPNIEFNDMGAR